MNEACQNTDKELWRKRPGDFYSPSIHVTEHEGIGINCRGLVIVASVEKWHEAGKLILCSKASWKRKLAIWLLRYKTPPLI